MKALSIALSLAPGLAQALSCDPANMTDDFLYASEQGGQPWVLVGELDYAADYRSDEDAFEFEGRFRGYTLRPGGNSAPLLADAIIQGQCINGDCGYLGASGTEQIFLARPEDGILYISVLPCAAFPASADPQSIGQMQACVDGSCQ